MIVTIVNEKGGSGKSTICINLAIKLLKENEDVVVLDVDTQRSIKTFIDIRLDSKLEAFSYFERSGNIYDTLEKIQSKFENILIDTKGESSIEIQKIMKLSDIVLVPVLPSQLDVSVFLSMIDRIEDIRILNPKLKTIIIPNRMPTIYNLKEKNTLISFIKNVFFEINKKDSEAENSYFLTKSTISERMSYKRSVSEGLGIIEYKDTKAINEFNLFYEEYKSLIGEKVWTLKAKKMTMSIKYLKMRA